MRGRLAEVVLGCSGHYIDPTSVGEIVYESLFVLEIVNSTSVAQKTKMIRYSSSRYLIRARLPRYKN